MNLKTIINLRVAGRIKRYIFMMCISCSLAASLPCYSFSFFDSFGVRPQSLGGAYTALADDASAVFLNPAGIAQSNKLQALIYYTNMFPDVSEWNIQSGGMSTSFATYGNVYFGVGYAGLLIDKGFYKETMTSIPAAYTFFKNENTAAHLGMSVKFLSIGYGSDIEDYSQGDPVFEKKTTTKFSADLGALITRKIEYTEFRFGIAGRNLKEADFGIVKKDVLWPEYHFGLGVVIEPHEVDSRILSAIFNRNPKVLFEMTMYKYYSELSAGIELTYEPVSLQLGAGTNSLSCGLSVQALKYLRVDIGSVFYSEMGSYSPQISLNYGF
ncbi:MAG: hypothetical protein WC976_07095 [Caldisericia bacterium]